MLHAFIQEKWLKWTIYPKFPYVSFVYDIDAKPFRHMSVQIWERKYDYSGFFFFFFFLILFLSVPAYRSGYSLIWRVCVQIVNKRKVLT